MTRHAAAPRDRAKAPPRADAITYLCILGVVLIWASSYPVIAAAVASFSPLALTALRLALSTSLLWLYALFAGERIRIARGDLFPLLGLGFLLNTLFQIGLNASLLFTTQGRASLSIGTMPIFAALVARLVLGERLTARRAMAIAMAFAGVSLVIASGPGLAGTPNAVLGDLLAIGAAAAWAVGSVLAKPFLSRYSPLRFSVLTLAAGAVTGIPVGAAALAAIPWRSIPMTAWLALLYLSMFSMAVAWVLWHRAIARLDVSQVAIFSNMTPVVTLCLSALLSGERLTLPLLAGAALVVAGAYLTQRT